MPAYDLDSVGTPVTNDLVTVADVKLRLNLDSGDTSKDALIAAVVTAASDAVRNYTSRAFGTDQVTETRTFAYDGSGWLDLPDAQSVSAVTVNGSTISTDLWVTGPDNGLVVEWVELPQGYVFTDPVMGFTRNLDRIPSPQPRYAKATVTAVWGWPVVPADVQQATVWTALALMENPAAVVRRSINSYSVEYENPLQDPIPVRAQRLLEPYTRIQM